MSKSALVAGGAGFIGSHLVRYLLDKDYKVTVLDDFSTGRMSNLIELKNDITIKDGTIASGNWSDVHFFDDGFDEIYNLACPASPKDYQASPIKTIVTCVHGNFELLKLARKCRARYFFASTSEVYGDPTVHPQPETYTGNVNTYGIRSCYDEGKRMGETICREHREFVPIRIGRLFNTYGPRMQRDDGRVVSNFCVQVAEERDLTVYGDGNQTRSFCYIDDMVPMIYQLMQSDCDTPVNLGNPAEFRIRDLLDVVLSVSGRNVPIVYKPQPQDDPKVRKPDMTKAHSLGIGLDLKTNLYDGIRKTYAYFKG